MRILLESVNLSQAISGGSGNTTYTKTKRSPRYRERLSELGDPERDGGAHLASACTQCGQIPGGGNFPVSRSSTVTFARRATRKAMLALTGPCPSPASVTVLRLNQSTVARTLTGCDGRPLADRG